jgi:hypothetical protein
MGPFPRLPRSSALLGVLLLGCPKAGSHPAGSASVPIPKQITWTENISFEGFPPAQVKVAQNWTVGKPQAGHETWELVELQTDAKGEHERTRTRIYDDATGFGYVAATTKEGDWALYMPEEQVLPADPKVGATWHGVHNRADQSIDRSCEIQASPWCAGGMVTVCDTHTGDFRRIFRDHFCPGVGWAGFEAMQAGPQGKVRIWSSDVVIDGKPAPAPKDALLPG